MRLAIWGLMTILAAVMCYWMVTGLRKEVRYDCRMLHGGWHPDVPMEVQKQCKDLTLKK